MQALSEGFAILAAKRELDLNLENIATVWQDGSVIRSWLLDVAVEILSEDPTLAGIAPRVADSGEGRLAVREAIDLNVAAPVITTSLLARIKSQDGDGYAERLLSAMRSRFGGHVVFGTREE
jgi:6-phosphogluconate dehydrogenase